jgi:hypothetical protein
LEFEKELLLPGYREEWSRAVDQALGAKENTPEARRSRQKVAQQHDWEILTMQAAQRMAERLGCDDAALDIARAMSGCEASVPQELCAGALGARPTAV